MSLKIICSGYLLRYPLGGMTFHHLQYLLGLKQLGHQVIYFEDYGWANSCYDPQQNLMTSEPSYGIAYFENLLREYNPLDGWCYLSEDGKSYGMERQELAEFCQESDVYFNLSNINFIPETELCRNKILIDTDPVFTQIGGHGMSNGFAKYNHLFTYGENIHRKNCTMPTANSVWKPTRQPIVLDLWKAETVDLNAPISTVMSWTAYGDKEFEGKIYGQKNREFEPYFDLPSETKETFELAVASVPESEKNRLISGGWRLKNAFEATETPQIYQCYLQNSRAEFSVAKHAYVSTKSGWFSDRSAGYLASGKPVIVQNTGFSDFLPCGEGLFAFDEKQTVIDSIKEVSANYEKHCQAARQIAEEFFDAKKVLQNLLENCL
jgi:hypothetical protein